jgi:hypothetical protein
MAPRQIPALIAAPAFAGGEPVTPKTKQKITKTA